MVDPTVLRSIPLFAGLAPEALAALAARCLERRYATGEPLFTRGEMPRGLFVVLEGGVRVVRDTGGRRHVVHEETVGGTLGEVPLFEAAEGRGYPATAVAAEPTRCLLVDRAALSAAMARDPELAWRALARLARRVRTLVDRLDAVTGRSVGQRLAALVLERRARARGATFTLGATQQAVAEELGTVREVIVRGLRALCHQGAVRAVGRGRYLVADERLLRAAAGELDSLDGRPVAPPS